MVPFRIVANEMVIDVGLYGLGVFIELLEPYQLRHYILQVEPSRLPGLVMPVGSAMGMFAAVLRMCGSMRRWASV